MSYPSVINEFKTIEKVSQGFSLARFGDGEFKMSVGNGYRRQVGSDKLARELTRILTNPSPRCIVGIPNLDKRSPKIESWLRHRERFSKYISQDVQYYSSFVSRPDSAPWIDTVDYASSIARLWEDKRVAVLCEKKGSMHRAVKYDAAKAIHIECPRFQAYDVIDSLEKAIIRTKCDIAILSCGPSATCLADRLSRHGIHAVDLGSIGQFICRSLYS